MKSWWPLALWMLGCNRAPPEREHPMGKYWLVDTYLMKDGPNFVSGPRQVELFAGGRIKADGEELGVFEPKRTLPGHGLALYAARTTPLLDLEDRSLTWGRLDAGAFVAVRPIDGGYEVAPGPPFGERRFFVVGDDLTTTPPDVGAAPAGNVHCGAIAWRPIGSDEVAWTDPCVAVELNGTRIRQRFFGVVSDGERVDDAPCTPDVPSRCVAEAVVELVEGRRWVPAPGAMPRTVTSLPAHHLTLVRGARMHRHLENADPYLIAPDGKCVAVARYVARDELRPIRTIASLADGRVVVSTALGRLVSDRMLLEVGGGEGYADLLAPKLSERAVSYAVSDVERWFFSKRACESADDDGFRRHPGVGAP